MKNRMFGAVIALFTVVAMSSCEKEEIGQSVTTEKEVAVQKDTPAPYVSISLAAGSVCGTTSPCGTTSEGIVQNNSVTFTNLTQAYFSTLTYTFYKLIGVSHDKITEWYQPITNAQHTCGAYSSTFAKTSLTNNAKILVIANETSSSGPSLSANLILNTTTQTLFNWDGTEFTMPSLFDFKTVILGANGGLVCGGGDIPTE